MVVRTVEVLAMGIEVVEVELGAPVWALDIIRYLVANEVPDDKWKAWKVRNKVVSCTIVDSVLY